MPKRTAKKITLKKDLLEADLYNPEGKLSGKVALRADIFNAEVNDILLAQSVRVYLSNQREGSHDAKTRSEVSGTTKKIYKQKGTGRARHGDKKAPIFIGGGKAHGPKPRDYSLKLPKKMRRIALTSALSVKLRDNGIWFMKGLADIAPKTKNMAKILKNLKTDALSESYDILLVIAKEMENVKKAARNLKIFSIRPFDLLNAYEVLSHKKILFTKEALEGFQNTFMKDVTKKQEEIKIQVNKKSKKQVAKKEITAKRTVKKGVKNK